MKSFLALMSLVFAVNVMAVETTKTILDHADVVEMDRALTAQGKKLFQVKDLYAEAGIRPRCMCESFELSYTKLSNRSKLVETYVVTTTGYGANADVKVKLSSSSVTLPEVRD